jgi:hypothetical protein
VVPVRQTAGRRGRNSTPDRFSSCLWPAPRNGILKTAKLCGVSNGPVKRIKPALATT